MKNTNTLAKSIILSVLALACVSGCDNDSSSNDDNQVTITFYNTFGQSIQSLMDREIAAFEDLYPNITVKSTSVAGSYDDLESQTLQQIAAGTTPTMITCYPDHVADYINYLPGCIYDLSNFIDDDELGFNESDGSYTDSNGNVISGVDDYIAAFWQEGCNYTYDGEAYEGVYSVPFAKSTEVMFYNKDVFDAYGWSVPTTWDEMWNLCKTIMELPEFSSDENFRAPLGYDSDSNFFITLCEQYGYDYTTAYGDSHFLFNNDDVKGMLTQLKEYYDLGYFFTKGTSSNNTYTNEKFTAGECLMTIGSTGGTTYNQTGNFTVATAMPPAVDASSRSYVSQGPSICIFSRASQEEKEAAWLFYKFITNTTNGCYYAMETGYMPPRQSSVLSSTYQDFINSTGANESLLTLSGACQAEMTDYLFTSDVFSGSATARDQVGSVLSAVLIYTGSDIENYIDTQLANAMSACLSTS